MKLTPSTSGRDECQVELVAGSRVELGGDRAAHDGVRSLDRVHRVAQLGDLVEALLGGRRVLARDHDLRELAVVSDAGRVGAHDALDLA